MAYQGIDRLVAHFLAVADEGGVTRAAAELNISQPALSRSIRMLEDRIGVPLFHRRSSGVELTAYGRLLARRARAMQLEYEHALTEIDALLHGREGIIRIGAIPAWETIYIPRALTAARDKLEGINFTVVGGATRPLLAQLREGAIDLACIALEELTPPDIATEVLMDMERVVVSSAAHPLARKKTVTAEDLLKYPWSQLKGDEITPIQARRLLFRLRAGAAEHRTGMRIQLFADFDHEDIGNHQHRSQALCRAQALRRGDHPAHPGIALALQDRHRLPAGNLAAGVFDVVYFPPPLFPLG